MKQKTLCFAVIISLMTFFACSSEDAQKNPSEDQTVINTPPVNPPPPLPPAIDMPEVKEPLKDTDAEYFCVQPEAMKLKREASGYYQQDFNTEEYDRIHENGFRLVTNDPLSTFSIDVDAASYSNVRRFLNNSSLPPPDAVRIEEMINYFDYNYPQPKDNNPFSITAEAASCPWNEGNYIVHIGLKGKEIETEKLPPSNIVFLIDVSGSMNSPNKLPLLKNAFKLLTNQLRENDRVAIAVYAGAAGLVLPSVSGDNKETIISALEKLEAGGSTAGAEGIQLAYETANKYFIKGGNNRVILATDGDFNVGPSSDGELERIIEEKRKQGIFLTILGFGMGNYKDSKMEKLSNKGNGNYAYIDNLLEAKKVLINEFGGTLFTIAKDVKIQVEFNPELVKAYRLIGYENRMLNKEDFNDDKKDAGELGSGHTVTALYEIVPAGSDFPVNDTDPLKYQNTTTNPVNNFKDEILTVKFRYKNPDSDKSNLIVKTVKNKIDAFSKSSENLKFSSAVACFGMILRNSEFKGKTDYNFVLNTAKNNLGIDKNGYRQEFLKLVETAKLLSN